MHTATRFATSPACSPCCFLRIEPPRSVRDRLAWTFRLAWLFRVARSFRLAVLLISASVLVVAPPSPVGAARLIEAEVETDLVPSPVPYAVLVPDDYDASGEPLPLLYDLHGGGGDRSYLAKMRPIYQQLWQSGELPPMVVVTPSVTPRGLYMDYRDGSQRWETFLIGPMLQHLRQRYRVGTDRRSTLVTGISMGGMGALRLAFKHPDLFLAVAAMEPGIEPVLAWRDIRPKHRFWRSDRLFETVFGRPVDADYWAANNPASIADADPQRLRQSGLAIYIECGDRDLFWLYEGAEFLHQVLWRHRIRHEYHLVYGADHLGPSIRPRKIESLKFLARVLYPPKADPTLTRARRLFRRAKERLTEKGHLEPDAAPAER